MAITTKQTGNAVTITMDGEHFEILKRVADALNTLAWDTAHDNTPETVCREWVAWMIHDDFDPPSQFAAGVVDSIYTHADGDAELDAARKADVQRAFEEAGLLPREGGMSEAGAVETGEEDTSPEPKQRLAELREGFVEEGKLAPSTPGGLEVGENGTVGVPLYLPLFLVRRIEHRAEKWGVDFETAAVRMLGEVTA